MGSECGTEFKDWSKRIKRIMRKGAVKPLFYGIGNCSCSSGTSTRIAKRWLCTFLQALSYFVEKKLKKFKKGVDEDDLECYTSKAVSERGTNESHKVLS